MGYAIIMLDFVTIDSIATKAARSKIPTGLERVVIEPAVDSDGNDALRITMVLTPDRVAALSGDDAIDLLVAVQQELVRQQEERVPIVQYATEAELQAEIGDEE